MSGRLWIEEPASQHDDESKKLAELLADMLNVMPDVQAELELVNGLKMGDVPWPNPFRARIFWSTYILDLRGTPTLRNLVEHMADRFPPHNGAFRHFLELKTGSSLWYDVVDPLELQFVGSGAAEPMINRRRLRDELGKLHQEGYRTLNITGASDSGKTFSYQLVQALATRQDLPLVLVDIAEWGDERFTARELVTQIARQLKITVDTDQVLTVPDPHTRARLLMFALRDEFPRSKQIHWIMIDGLDRANVDPDARAFVEKFLRSIDVNGQPANVRLVVTGFSGILPRQACREPIEAIIRKDVKDLFDKVGTQLGHPASAGPVEEWDAQLEEWTEEVWSEYDPGEDDLADLGEAIYRLVRDEILTAIGQPA